MEFIIWGVIFLVIGMPVISCVIICALWLAELFRRFIIWMTFFREKK